MASLRLAAAPTQAFSIPVRCVRLATPTDFSWGRRDDHCFHGSSTRWSMLASQPPPSHNLHTTRAAKSLPAQQKQSSGPAAGVHVRNPFRVLPALTTRRHCSTCGFGARCGRRLDLPRRPAITNDSIRPPTITIIITTTTKKRCKGHALTACATAASAGNKITKQPNRRRCCCKMSICDCAPISPSSRHRRQDRSDFPQRSARAGGRDGCCSLLGSPPNAC